MKTRIRVKESNAGTFYYPECKKRLFEGWLDIYHEDYSEHKRYSLEWAKEAIDQRLAYAAEKKAYEASKKTSFITYP